MREIRTSGSMSGDGKRSVAAWPKLPRPSSTLPPLPRQRRLAHEKLVHGVRALAAFADRPHHQRLAAAHIAAGEHLGQRARIGRYVGLDVAAWIELDAERFDHAFVHGMHEAHGEQNKLGRQLELASGNGVDLAVDAHAMKLLHAATFT